MLHRCITSHDVIQRSAQSITSHTPSRLGMFSRGARVIWCSHVLHVPCLTQAIPCRHKVDLWPSDLWGDECGSKGGGNLATEESCGYAGRVFKKTWCKHTGKRSLWATFIMAQCTSVHGAATTAALADSANGTELVGTGSQCIWKKQQRGRECACALAAVFRFLLLKTTPTSKSPTLMQSRGSIRSRDSFLHTAV